MNSVLKRFLLIYASETGQSQAIAEEIRDSASKYGFVADFHCISKADKEFSLQNEKIAVFIASTTGDGDPPETARKCWRRISKRTLPSNTFSQLKYCLLALGDSNYTTFCNFGKCLDKRLQQLGGTKFLDTAYGDDAVGLETAVEPWLETLWPALQKACASVPATHKAHRSIVQQDSITAQEILKGIMAQKDIENDVKAANGIVSNGLDKDSLSGQTDDLQLIKNVINLHLVDETRTVTEKDKQEGEEVSISSSNTSITRTSDECILNSRDDSQNSHLTLPSASLIDTTLTLPTQSSQFLNIVFDNEQTSRKETQSDLFQLNDENVTYVPITSASKLTTDDAVKTVIEISLDVTELNFQFLPGDYVYVFCPNETKEVEVLMKRLGITLQADIPMKLDVAVENKKGSTAYFSKLPADLTLRKFITHYCDLRAVPKKACLRLLADYADNLKEKRRLLELSSRQGAEDYSQFIRKENLSILDVLLAFSSCNPPIDRLIEHIPRLSSRPYSVASSPLVNHHHLRITFTLVEDCKSSSSAHLVEGLCTGWLNSITKELQLCESNNPSCTSGPLIKIPIILKHSLHFHLPSNSSAHIIMIAAGAGLAPFVGFLEHREMEIKNNPDCVFGEMWLFYGCRHQEKDFLYRNTIEKLKSSGILTQLFVTFSREFPDDETKHKRYVQHALLENGKQILNMVHDKKAIIYVCGDAQNMAKDVHLAIQKILIDHLKLQDKEAENYIKQMQLNKQYLQDIWT